MPDSTPALQEFQVATPSDEGRLLDVAIFESVTTVLRPERRVVTLPTLASIISDPKTYASKEACDLLVMGTFGPTRNPNALQGKLGSYRWLGNRLSVSGIEGDHDAGTMEPREAVELLEAAGIRALVYTSANNRVLDLPKYNGGPRWRVLAPLSKDCTPSERAAFVDLLNGVLRGALGPESWNTDRSYYYGRVEDVAFEMFLTEGDYLDLDLIGIAPISKPRKASANTTAATPDVAMPELLPEAELPTLDSLGLDDNARAVLIDGDFGDDASKRLAQATANLYRRLGKDDGVAYDGVVLSLLFGNPYVASYVGTKRSGDDEALDFLWKYHCLKERRWANGDYVLGEFDVIVSEPGAVSLPNFTRNRMGLILGTVPNILKALRAPHVCGWKIGRDLFTDDIMIAPDGTDEWRTLIDDDITAMREHLMRDPKGGFTKVAKDEARDVVSLVARENQFDSATRWLSTLQWDGVERVAGFCARYLGAEDTPYTHAVARYLWSALAGRVMHPGVKCDMVPVLIGAQGLRKSSAVFPSL